MTKIGRNEKCPCGSGKKYKNCCGARNRIPYANIKRSDLMLEDFVLNNLSEDLTFFEDALQLLIGPNGYNFCSENAEELEREYQKDGFRNFIKEDRAGVSRTTAKSDKKAVLKTRPYGGVVLEEQEDIVSLLKKGHICAKGRQVELFHAYLMNNLIDRFDDYMYIPNPEVMKKQDFGSFARRGFDFLVGITLYLELQLGVHVYMSLVNKWEFPKETMDTFTEFLGIKNLAENEKPDTGLMLMLTGYIEMIHSVSEKYDAKSEVELYNRIGAYREKEYPDRLAALKPSYYPELYQFNYIRYLQYLVSSICFNSSALSTLASMSFPQCDLLKYLFGIESITEVFEDNLQSQKVSLKNHVGDEMIRELEEASGKTLKKEYPFDRTELYHSAVFWFLDELNGQVMSVKPAELKYQDFADIGDDDYTERDGLMKINPARKSTRINRVRKLRMEIYNALNGKCLALKGGTFPGDVEGCADRIVCKYPILPWLSSGKEPTIHCRPYSAEAISLDKLYSLDAQDRMEFLNMEYRLTAIPVNCIEEYLNPDVFYKWEERNELLKVTREQNEQLKVINENLKRHIELNQELVRNLSHSSGNYLNSERLAKTGVKLHEAVTDNPTIDQLHLDGLSLLLQSEQEMYLSRQLNSLVWRCSADINELTEQIKKSISKKSGTGILSPVEFALKTVMARVLFREEDRRAQFIKNKLEKSSDELVLTESSFMLDVLAEKNSEGFVVEWWNRNIGNLSVTVSPFWEKLRLKKDRTCYDLIVEIVTEQVLNALSHGDIKSGFKINFGQAEEFKGRPRWTFIECVNRTGDKYTGGREVGISSLNETVLLLNNSKRGMETENENGMFTNRTWLLSSLLKAL